MQNTISRKEILSLPLNKTITSIEAREIAFEPGQLGGRHKHPCPVVGYILEGSAVLEVEGQPPQSLPAAPSMNLRMSLLRGSITPPPLSQ